jgi:hypothetical protein
MAKLRHLYGDSVDRTKFSPHSRGAHGSAGIGGQRSDQVWVLRAGRRRSILLHLPPRGVCGELGQRPANGRYHGPVQVPRHRCLDWHIVRVKLHGRPAASPGARRLLPADLSGCRGLGGVHRASGVAGDWMGLTQARGTSMLSGATRIGGGAVVK